MQPLSEAAFSESSFNYHRWLAASRMSVYALLLSLGLLFHLSQSGFYQWQVYRSLYGISGLGLIVHVLGFFALARLLQLPHLVLFWFLMDVVLLGALLWLTQLSSSIFVFLFLFQILVASLWLGARGGWILAAAASLVYSASLVSSVEIRPLTFFFSLLLNNAAFFLVAWIGGQLSLQLTQAGYSLRIVRELHRQIVEKIPSGLVSLDSEGTILEINPGAARVLSRLRVGENFSQLVPEAGELLDRSRQMRKPMSSELRLESEHAVQVLGCEIVPDVSDRKETLVVLLDRTEMVQMEFQLKQREKLAALGSLVTGIAHEIRNPLAGMSGNLELAMDPTLQPELRSRVAKNVFREVDRLNRIISELMEYAKPEKPPSEFVAIDEVLKDVLETLTSDPSFRPEISLRREIAPVPRIRGHRDKLKQAFLNVLINSVQAFEKTDHPVLEVRASASGESVEVLIRDNGCGMSPETKAKMFEPFVTTKAKGTGLGLPVTHKILEAHRASFQVETGLGQGTQFRILFPREFDARMKEEKNHVDQT